MLDKPGGITSNAALQRARRLYANSKAGHSGTLDPLACGLLPICFGEATKFAQILSDSDKRYEATIVLGWRSSTGDSEGELVECELRKYSDSELSETLDSLTGEIDQIPPMHSAVKVGGTRLYTLARKGVEVARKPRKVTIHEIRLIDSSRRELRIAIVCSKGTYIRSLAQELGERLGCGGYLGRLRRTGVGPFSSDDAVDFDELEALDAQQRLALVRPVDALVASLPAIVLRSDELERLQHGLEVAGNGAACHAKLIRIYDHHGHFFGVGRGDADGRLRASRLVSHGYWKSLSP